jgi:hypothetical protein
MMEDNYFRLGLWPSITNLRKKFEEPGIVDDRNGIKIDNKYRPLTYFQEGVSILPLEDYIEKLHEAGNDNAFIKRSSFDQPKGRATFGDSELSTGQYDAILAAVDHAIKVDQKLPEDKRLDLSATKQATFSLKAENLKKLHAQAAHSFGMDYAAF